MTGLVAARALQISKGVVAKYVRLAEAAELGPAEMLALSEHALLARLRPTRPAPLRHVPPDNATTHQELKRKGVTLMLLWEEFVATHPGASNYRYSQFVGLRGAGGSACSTKSGATSSVRHKIRAIGYEKYGT